MSKVELIKTFIKLTEYANELGADGLEITVTGRDGGKLKCKFEYEAILPEDMMTIKELCENKFGCKHCIYTKLCTKLIDIPAEYNDHDNREITKTIIETARALTEVDND